MRRGPSGRWLGIILVYPGKPKKGKGSPKPTLGVCLHDNSDRAKAADNGVFLSSWHRDEVSDRRVSRCRDTDGGVGDFARRQQVRLNDIRPFLERSYFVSCSTSSLAIRQSYTGVRDTNKTDYLDHLT